MRFAGKAIDGPKRGQNIEHDIPVLRIVLRPPLACPGDYANETICLYEAQYIWVYSLGQWAFIAPDERITRWPRPPNLWHYPEDIIAERNDRIESIAIRSDR